MNKKTEFKIRRLTKNQAKVLLEIVEAYPKVLNSKEISKRIALRNYKS